MFINGMPKEKVKRYIVYRTVNGESWYWGSWDTAVQAENIAELVSGSVYDSGESR